MDERERAMSGKKTPDFQTIFESSPEPCLILSPDLKIEAASDAYLQHVRATREDLIGQSLFDVLSTGLARNMQDETQMLRDSLDRLICDKKTDVIPTRHADLPGRPGTSGEKRHWYITNAPVCAADGKLLHIIHRLDDVTEHVQPRQCESVQEESTELTRSKAELEQFAYAASHDLQEPLRMVSSYVQLLARRYQGKLDKDAEDFIGFALDGTKRMQLMIADLLRFSRVGTQGKPFAPTSLDALLDRVLTVLRSDMDKANAVVTRSALPVVKVDELQIGQLFQHLIENALKFRGDAPPKIHIGYQRRGDEHVFSVEDNGIGIEPQYLERIFVIFRRLHARDAYPGTGIGLALCKRVVERHHGRIWAESAPGQGTVFYFTLPDREGDSS